jgi:CheY-like chemotaxis protein/HPt (histidine-containing phosphotransfer) domain-containing protein
MDAWAYLDEFRAEADEHLRALDDQLLHLERDPRNPAPVRLMFLSAHTIKGGAAMLGLADVKSLAHAMEDELARLRDADQSRGAANVDLLFQATDVLRDLVARVTPDTPADDPRLAPLIGALRRTPGVESPGSSPGQPAVLASGPPAPVAPGAPPPGPGAAPLPALAPPRALLVEDSPTVRMLESMLLTDAGYTVEALADGAEALARALQEPYALLVTGVETPGLRGLELAAQVRQAPGGATLPIIIMSSDENPANRERAAAAGVSAYIRKGAFGEQRLLDAARELLPQREE